MLRGFVKQIAAEMPDNCAVSPEERRQSLLSDSGSEAVVSSPERVTTTCLQVTNRSSSPQPFYFSMGNDSDDSLSLGRDCLPARPNRNRDGLADDLATMRSQPSVCRHAGDFSRSELPTTAYASAPARLNHRSTTIANHLNPSQQQRQKANSFSARDIGVASTTATTSAMPIFDKLTVKGSVPPGLFCTKCRSVLRDPVQISCGDRYCHLCARSLING